ncbi:hypothetical protein SUGI_0406890 [Cryptomeria japonica]|uniref:uncharacterized protein LOC131060408 n=1 Tax=Cryptomeria japonica TaxID=3369 RepID=UPI002408F18D|nr:uncharacterized protein LOC131060408 [Cryptomeria japonica]GLJ21797.1 hypothetical protein SUGI_0406890 [Cryptomeria japonica]
MEGSESSEASCNSKNNGRNSYLGLNRLQSGKISKVVKRSIIQPPKQQAPLYTIDKDDFRSIVQRLTGSPAAPQPPPVAPPPPPNPNPPPNPAPPRLQRPKPPPLQSVFSFNKLVSNPNLAAMNAVSSSSSQPKQQNIVAPATISTAACTPNFAAVGVSAAMPLPFIQSCCSSGLSLPIYSSFQSLAPSRGVWANPGPRAAVPHMTDSSSFGASLQFAHGVATGQRQSTSPFSPLFLQSPAANSQQQFPYVSPLPSPGSQFQLSQLLAGSQVPFSPGSFVPLSPSEQFQFGQLPPPSPGSLFPLSPAAQFRFSSF